MVPDDYLIDAHAHFWAQPAGGDRGVNAADRPVSADELVALMAAGGVAQTLQVTRYFEPDDAVSIAGAAAHPDRFRVLARLDSRTPEFVERVRATLEQPYVVGLRLYDLQTNPGLFDRSGDALWRLLAELRRPASLYLPGYSRALATTARRNPDTQFVLDHAGVALTPGVPPERRFDDWTGVLALAQLPNVVVKASGLPEAGEETFPYPQAQDRLLELVGCFGAQRVMWGSNFTPARRVGEYAEHADFARVATAQLPSPDRAAVRAGTAARVFDLRPPQE